MIPLEIEERSVTGIGLIEKLTVMRFQNFETEGQR
jgi:hypothetical protein